MTNAAVIYPLLSRADIKVEENYFVGKDTNAGGTTYVVVGVKKGGDARVLPPAEVTAKFGNIALAKFSAIFNDPGDNHLNQWGAITVDPQVGVFHRNSTFIANGAPVTLSILAAVIYLNSTYYCWHNTASGDLIGVGGPNFWIKPLSSTTEAGTGLTEPFVFEAMTTPKAVKFIFGLTFSGSGKTTFPSHVYYDQKKFYLQLALTSPSTFSETYVDSGYDARITGTHMSTTDPNRSYTYSNRWTVAMDFDDAGAPCIMELQSSVSETFTHAVGPPEISSWDMTSSHTYYFNNVALTGSSTMTGSFADSVIDFPRSATDGWSSSSVAGTSWSIVQADLRHGVFILHKDEFTGSSSSSVTANDSTTYTRATSESSSGTQTEYFAWLTAGGAIEMYAISTVPTSGGSSGSATYEFDTGAPWLLGPNFNRPPSSYAISVPSRCSVTRHGWMYYRGKLYKKPASGTTPQVIDLATLGLTSLSMPVGFVERPALL